MAGRAVKVILSKKRRRKLEQIVRAASSPQRLVLRAKIVLAADGAANAQVARDLGCSVATVRQWRGRFAVRGIPGLFDKPRSGRPRPTARASGWPWSRSPPLSRRTANRSGRGR